MRISDLVIFHDHQLMVMNKPPGMPVQEDSTGDPSLHRIAQAYCKHDLYVVHRLDRPCSGVTVFAKTRTAAAHLSRQFASHSIAKHYLAVVNNGIQPEETELLHYLVKSGKHKMRIQKEPDGATEARLAYKVVDTIERYSLLDVTLHTGRLHQIRVQLAAIGYPVKGDVKYGFRRSNQERFIHLHAHRLTLLHPSKEKQMTFSCHPPDDPVWNAFDLNKLTTDTGTTHG